MFFIFSKQDAISQFGFSHEIGIISGPIAFYGDYGQRNNFDTNTNNTTIGVGLIHYLNFSYSADCNCYTRGKYFNDHFKLRNEIDFYKVDLQHYGEYVDPSKTSVTADQLRAMYGSTTVFDIGSQLEYYPFSIRDFAARPGNFAPFVSAGIHFVSFDPEVYSTLGSLNSSVTTPEKYFGAFQQEGGSTWSFVASVGMRYKLSHSSDIMIDTRWQSYFSNWVDGLNPQQAFNGDYLPGEGVPVPENKANDWIYWLNFGYILYVD
ncbi:hypothetical protein SCB49_05165 [unidentified eubacterium SCB49]|nr:hypothetical protein SCB49_05165 [unidentified eubacterium SCB49]